MNDKNAIVVGAGLVVIISIVVLITYGNSMYANLSAKAANATSYVLLEQKDIMIKKLAKELKAKQTELASIKGEIASVNAKINSTKTDLK